MLRLLICFLTFVGALVAAQVWLHTSHKTAMILGGVGAIVAWSISGKKS